MMNHRKMATMIRLKFILMIFLFTLNHNNVTLFVNAAIGNINNNDDVVYRFVQYDDDKSPDVMLDYYDDNTPYMSVYDHIGFVDNNQNKTKNKPKSCCCQLIKPFFIYNFVCFFVPLHRYT